VQNFASSEQESLSFDSDVVPSGSLDDSSVIRGVLIQSIKRSVKTRAAIAEQMEYLLARTITEKMLNAFTAESRDDRRWPAEFDRAFCKATGDNTLLACRAEMAGLHVITDEEKMLLELGRQFLLRNQADEQIALLQRRLHGRAL
jgi:hypothetical protein